MPPAGLRTLFFSGLVLVWFSKKVCSSLLCLSLGSGFHVVFVRFVHFFLWKLCSSHFECF